MIRMIVLVLVLAGWLGMREMQAQELSGDKRLMTFRHDGLERRYYLRLPSNFDSPRLHPVVLLLHGGGSHGRGMDLLTRNAWHALADQDGVILLYPEGFNRHWNDGRNTARTSADDVGFLSALITRTIDDYAGDPRRVYAGGISNGGMMSLRLACERSEQVAAIAVVAGSLPENLKDSCQPASPVSLLLMHGTDDALVPYDGGEVRIFRQRWGRVIGAEETVRLWAEHLGAGPLRSVEKRAVEDGITIERFEATRNKAGTGDQDAVSFYKLFGAGHVWPSGIQYLPERLIGKNTQALNATTLVWDFFRAHPKP